MRDALALADHGDSRLGDVQPPSAILVRVHPDPDPLRHHDGATLHLDDPWLNHLKVSVAG